MSSDVVGLGVDFGSSHTVAMVRHNDSRMEPLLFDGSPLLPSAVFAATGGDILVGKDALSAARMTPSRLEPNPKRRIDDGTVLLGDREFPVAELFAAVLDRIRRECVSVLGAVPSTVVLTHPAVWGPTRRQVLREAADKAGLAGARMVPEPVAAAHYFARQLGHEVAVGDVVVVHDFGGGTFDASVVSRAKDGFQVVSVDGLGDLGGVDIDAAIIARLRELHGDPATWNRLLSPDTTADRHTRSSFIEDVRAVKERLSRHTSADIYIPIVDTSVHLTREELDHVARPLLARVINVVKAVMADAAVPESSIAEVFLVGGASRMPLVATMLHQALGRAPIVTDQLEQIVARGAVSSPLPPASSTTAAPRRPAEGGGDQRVTAALVAIDDLIGGDIDDWNPHCLVSAVVALAEIDPDRAARVADAAERCARGITDDQNRLKQLVGIAGRLVDVDSGRADRVADVAERLVLGMTDDGVRLERLVDIAVALAEIDPDRAARLVDAAGRLALSGTGDEGACERVEELAIRLAQSRPAAGFADTAEMLVQSITDNRERRWRMFDLARSLAGTDVGRAERIVLSYADGWSWRDVVAVAEALAATDPGRAGRLIDVAERLVRTDTLEELRLDNLIALAVTLVDIDSSRAQQIAEDAEALVHTLTRKAAKADTLAAVAQVWAGTDPDRAVRLLDEAERLAQDLFRVSRQDRARQTIVRALAEVARALAETDPDRALRLLGDAERLARDISEAAEMRKAVYDSAAALAEVARALAETNPDRALRLIDDTERLAHSVTEDPEGKWSRDDSATATAAAVKALAVTHPDRAVRVIDEAERHTHAIADTNLKVSVLRDFVLTLAGIDPERAQNLVRTIARPDRFWVQAELLSTLIGVDPDRAERLARTLTTGDIYPEALAQLAQEMAGTDPARAGRVAEEAERLARSRNDDEERVAGLIEIAFALAETDPDRARRLAGEAESLIHTVLDGEDRVGGLLITAHLFAETDPEQANRLVDEAERLTYDHADNDIKVDLLATIAGAHSRGIQSMSHLRQAW